LALSAVRAQVQAPSQNPPRGQATPVLRTTTRLVQINVIVHNKKREPVRNLKKEEFTILDDGKRQKIAAFSAVSADAVDANLIPPLPPNVFSNRKGPAAANPGSVTVLLFDALNTPIEDQQYARQQVLKFLRQLQPQDHMAIYVLTTKIRVLNEFTEDTTSLLQAIQKFRGYSAPKENAVNTAPSPVGQSLFLMNRTSTESMTEQLREIFADEDAKINDYVTIRRAATTTRALVAIANHVAHIPGRKNLIWVSGSFPIRIEFDGKSLSSPRRQQASFDDDLEQAARTLNQANMAIYPVDARGLMTSPHYSAKNEHGLELASPIAELGPEQKDFQTMDVLAERTGGKASYNANDIESLVRRAIADGQYTYTLGFYPTHGEWEGKFHELKVHVNHQEGLSLRHRKGYFAVPDPPRGPEENQAALEAALGSPVEWTNLNLDVILKVFDTSAHTVDVQVGLDTRELSLISSNGRWRDIIYVFVGQLGAEGKMITGEKLTFDLALTQETHDQFLKTGTKFSGRVTISPETVNLRIIAQDTGSGAIGTLTIPIKNYLAWAASGGIPHAAQKP
jgi:VWFA-related protein